MGRQWGTSGAPVGRQLLNQHSTPVLTLGGRHEDHLGNFVSHQGPSMYHPPTFPGDFEIPPGLCTTLPPVFVSCDFLNHVGRQWGASGEPVGRQWGASGAPVGRQWGTS